MAINYGANEVRSSGKIIGGDGQSDGRTLYFYAASGSDWNTVGNWFVDRDHTIASNSLPTDEDTAVILSTITSNSGSFVADTIIFEDGNLDFSSYNISEVRHIVLKNSSELKGYGTIGSSTGTRVKIDLYDSSKLYFTSSTTIYGDVNFHETSYIDTNSLSITIEGNVNVTSSGGNSSYQPIYGNPYGITMVLGNLRVFGNGSNTTTIRYVKVRGKTELFRNVKIMDCDGTTTSYGFYGPVILTDNCTIGNYVSFYNDVTLNEGSNIEGDTGVYFNAYSAANAADYKNLTLTLNTNSYFSTNSYIYMLGGTLVLNTKGAISNGSNVTINGDYYTTVEFRTNTGNGMSGTINCGTIKVFNNVSFGINSMPSLSSSIMKKIQFFNNSNLYSSLTVTNYCSVEFYDDSCITNSSTLTLGDNNTSFAKFYDRSYIDSGCTITNGSHVEMNDYTVNVGTISSNFAFFKGSSVNDGSIIYNASFSDRSDNYGTVDVDATLSDFATNNGTVVGSLISGGGGTKTYKVFTGLDNQPPASNFATLDTRNSIVVLDFDDSTKESAVFVGVIPEGATLTSGLIINCHWMATSATSGDCVWEVSLERCNTDLDSDSFDTVITGVSPTNATSGIVTVTSITLTTIDNVTAGDLYRLKVSRDAASGSDTMSGDAELIAVEIRGV